MQTLPIDRRALVVLTVCFGALLFSVISTLREQSNVVQDARNARHHLALFLASEEFEHDVQRERGLSVTYRSEPQNTNFQDALAKQRAHTDETFDSLRQLLEQMDADDFEHFGKQYSRKLAAARRWVDDKSSPKQTLRNYTEIVDLCQSSRARRLTQLKGEEAMVATVYQSLSVLEESAGKERALIAGALAEQKISADRLMHLSELKGCESTHLGFSLSLLSYENQLALEETIASEAYQVADRIRDGLLSSGEVPESLATEEWWEIQSRKIAQIHHFQSSLAESIQSQLEDSIAQANQHWWIAVGLAILPIFMLIFVATNHRHAQRQLKRSLKQSERRESMLLQECREAVFTLEGDKINDCNQQMLDLFNIDGKPELIGRSLFDLCKLAHSSESQTLNLEQKLHQVKNEGHVRFECQFHDADENAILGEVTLSCLEEPHGDVKILGMIFDVGERRRLERELAESRKLESIGQLSAGIAHEINTPLQCVISNIEFIQGGIERILKQADEYRGVATQNASNETTSLLDELDRKSRFVKTRCDVLEATEESAMASNRIVEIVRAMKTMSYQGNVEKKSCDLNQLIRDAASVSASRWKHVAKLNMDLDQQLGNVEVNPTQIGQVLLNLIVNAADAIDEKLGTEPDQLGEIKIQTRRVEDQVAIHFKDSGCGIHESKLYKIFDPFFTTKDVGKGTGQGLTIVYDVITNQHQGSIQIESEVGKGTEFLIHLPVIATEVQPV